MAPDGGFEATYFDDKVKHNLDCYYKSVTGPEASPLGTYTVCSDGGFHRFLQAATEEYRKTRSFSTWKELCHETFEVFTPRTVEGAQAQQYGPRGPDYGGSYNYILGAGALSSALSPVGRAFSPPRSPLPPEP